MCRFPHWQRAHLQCSVKKRITPAIMVSRPSVRLSDGIMGVVSPGVTHSHAREIQCQGGEEIRIPCLLLGSVTRIGLAAIEPPFCLREKAKPKAQKKSKCGTKSDTSIYISRPGTFLHITWISKERAMTVRCSRSDG